MAFSSCCESNNITTALCHVMYILYRRWNCHQSGTDNVCVWESGVWGKLQARFHSFTALTVWRKSTWWHVRHARVTMLISVKLTGRRVWVFWVARVFGCFESYARDSKHPNTSAREEIIAWLFEGLNKPVTFCRRHVEKRLIKKIILIRIATLLDHMLNIHTHMYINMYA